MSAGLTHPRMQAGKRGQGIAKIFFLYRDEAFRRCTLDSAQAELHALAKLGEHEIAPRLEGVVVPADDRNRVLKVLAQQREICIEQPGNENHCIEDVGFWRTVKLHLFSPEWCLIVVHDMYIAVSQLTSLFPL